ncbi:MAG: hypothetical protein BWY76_01816 [bacterium ADurb.Bin429]|nr:MAG: hypothetical protein BWY76_01816 [bacterium ADurb.Bin429]
MDQPIYQPSTCPLDAPAVTTMRSLVLIYHEDFEDAINGIIQRGMGVARYTKIRNVVGARVETMQDIDYQPESRNHMLILVADCDTVHGIARELKALRESRGHGVRGYITPVEEVI